MKRIAFFLALLLLSPAALFAACTSPAGNAGAMNWTGTVWQFCNASDVWTNLDTTGGGGTTVFNAGSSTSINFANGTNQYTSATCGAFTLSNIADGGVYTLRVTGGTAGTCVFTHSGLTMRLPSDHGATTANVDTLYTFTRTGTIVYMQWTRFFLPCNLPWGGTIIHGATATGFLAASVTCGNTCRSQVRTCNNGTLSGTHAFGSCNVGACANCTGTPWGTVAHGYSNTAYQYSAVCSCGSYSQTRSCFNGTFSGSFGFTGCTEDCGTSGSSDGGG